jgi:hypothetical protein
MVQSMNDNNPLSGVRVLVVEDDTLLAMDLKETLVDAGAIVVDVCQTLDEGMARANDDDFPRRRARFQSWARYGVAARAPSSSTGSSVHSLYGAVPRRTEPG